MALDPRTPVIVGVGQLARRLPSPEGAPSPAQLQAQVIEAAAEDAGVGRALVEALTSIRAVKVMSWRYTDLPGAVAQHLGVQPAELLTGPDGGNTPQLFLDDACEAILAGRTDVVAICGSEAVHSRTKARQAGVDLVWEAEEGAAPAAMLGQERPGTNDAESALGLFLPVIAYPVLEQALRHHLGRSQDEHLAVVGDLWSRFSEVAAGNPNAWGKEAMSAEEIVTPTASNRPIAHPYTKFLVANIQVDMAAAVILTSVEAARRLGVAEDRWVFPLAGAEAYDTWNISERLHLWESPAIRLCGEALRDATGIDPASADHVDLYSCFPIAVEIGSAALGMPLDRQLTLTGGLTFGGGPGNSYSLHGIGQVVDACRAAPGTVGLSSALGMYATKHAVGLYSTTPPEGPFQRRRVQDQVDALPTRAVVAEAPGPVEVETATVVFDREGAPERTIAFALTPAGERVLASTPDPDVAAEVVAGGLLGEQVKVDAGVLAR